MFYSKRKKMRTLLIAGLLMLSTCMHADSDYQVLIGAEYGQAEGKWNTTTGDWEDLIGIRAGVETDESRIFVSYHYQKLEDFDFVNTDYETQMLNANFEAKTQKYYGAFRVFAGGHVGVMYSEWSLGYYSPLTDEDDFNVMFGAQAGIILDLIDNAYLEAGYRYSLTDADTSSINPASVQSFYGAVNIKF